MQALLDAVNFAEQLVREFDPRRREPPTDGRTGGEGEGEADGDGGARVRIRVRVRVRVRVRAKVSVGLGLRLGFRVSG